MGRQWDLIGIGKDQTVNGIDFFRKGLLCKKKIDNKIM